MISTPLSMHKYSLLGISVLSLSLGVTSVRALEISDDITEPVSTSTADDGVAGDIEVTSAGSIVLETGETTPIITVDSSNTVSMAGEIGIFDTDSARGILLQGGNTSDLNLTGDIYLVEDYTREDTDDDGDADGAYAIGTDRIGILVSGAAPLDADLTLGAASEVNLEGNNSYALQILTELQGDLDASGALSVLGNNSTSLSVDALLDGDLRLSGSVTAQGEASVGVAVNDSISGAFVNGGEITTSGFLSTSASNYVSPDEITDDTIDLEDRIDAENLLVGGSAVEIKANVAQGFLNDGIIDSFIDDEEAADEDKDTIEDFDENRSTGSIKTYGSAPAISISAEIDGTNDDLVIGAVRETIFDSLDDDDDDDTSEVLATFDYDYGFINRGSISSEGLNHGFSATAIEIQGASDGSRNTLVEGGLFNSGSITASAYEASATAIDIGDFAQLDELWNEGSIVASMESQAEDSAVALQVAASSQLSSVFNEGTIFASATGDDAHAVAILDESGTLGSILNQGTIAASLTAWDSIDLGTAVAIDLSAASAAQPLSFLQEYKTPVDDINGDDVIDTDDVTTPSVIGDIYLGAGDDVFDVQAGTVTAPVFDFGAGTDQLSISNGAGVTAAISGLEDISLDGASLEFTNSTPVSIDNLTASNEAHLVISINLDNAVEGVAQLQASGTVSVDDTSLITTQFIGFQRDDFELDIIDAAVLDLGLDPGETLNIELPAIYTEVLNITATSLSLELETKSADEMGLTEEYFDSYDALLGLAEEVTAVGTKVTSFLNEQDFLAAYTQLLPDTAQVTAQSLAAQLDLSSSMTGNRLENIRTEGAGNWFQYTIGRGAMTGTDSLNPGYSGSETNLAFGLDREVMDDFYLGSALSLRTTRYTLDNFGDHEIRSTSYDLNLYSSAAFGGLILNTSLFVGLNDQYSDRQVNIDEVNELYSADWGGSYFAGSALVAYQKNFGNYFIRPSIALDMFQFSQDDYSEEVESDTGDLALSVMGTDTTLLSTTVKLNIGFENWAGTANTGRYGSTKQIYFGYRSDAGSDDYSTTASFLGGSGYDFDISRAMSDEAAFLFGINYTILSRDGNSVTIGYAGEQQGDFTRNMVQGEIRIGF